MLTAVVGINWGDEGKGRMVDMLGEQYNVVVRYQGGSNANHTVINERGRFVLNLLPSGILRNDTVNVMGPGMVIDLEHLCEEIERLREKGIEVSPDNLRISDKATICMPYHKLLDDLENKRQGDNVISSSKHGVAPAYSDKYHKRSLRMGDLRNLSYARERLEDIIEWKNLLIKGGYGHEGVTVEEMTAWLERYGEQIKDYVCDTSMFLSEAIENKKSIMFEAHLGALRDLDYGSFPYTSSSSCIAAYATFGAGIPGKKLDNVLGIMKAYSTCVGAGPFVCELFDETADRLREEGNEYGALSGKPRRVGGFDAVASRYGVMVQGATEIALTKLDVLSCLEKIPVCVAYEIDGERITDFPTGDRLMRAKPVYEYLEGFSCNISDCRSKADLPPAAVKYIEFLELEVGCKIRYVSVGPARDEYFEI